MRRLSNKPEKIIIHHTGGTSANPLADTSHHTYEIINQAHKVRFNYPASNGTYVGYQYIIIKSGNVVPATPENEEGIHTRGQNLNSIGIGLAGNFDIPNTLPTEEQKRTLKILIIKLRKKYGKLPIYPHRKYASKTCYGKNLSDSWAETLLIAPIEDNTIIMLQKQRISLQKKVISLLQQKVAELLQQLFRLKKHG